MSLNDLHLQHSYRTSHEGMVLGFFVPCLEQAILYRRATGYFTSHGLALAVKGVASLVSRGGRMRLVVSPHVEPDDIVAVQVAIFRRQRLLRAKGPAPYQPKAMPWGTDPPNTPRPEMAPQPSHPPMCRPFRAQYDANPNPSPSLWASMCRTFGAEELQRDLLTLKTRTPSLDIFQISSLIPIKL